jgi:hypothetical protein
LTGAVGVHRNSAIGRACRARRCAGIRSDADIAGKLADAAGGHLEPRLGLIPEQMLVYGCLSTVARA